MEPVLSNHEHSKFEIFCYCDVRTADPTTRRLMAMADVWRETGTLSDTQLADRICDDRIDILVELTGHMAGNRLMTFARKPAPIQVAYPGYPNSTGLSTIDYCLTDSARNPAGAEMLFCESLIRLEPTSQCYEPTDRDLEAGPSPLRRAGYVTFASLNNPMKLNAPVVETWSRILQVVKDSRLLLLVHPGTEKSLLKRFAAHHVGAERLQLVARLPRREYLELHRRIDINLDPWPFNGHTTLLDGLWMAVPAVALEGESHVSRVGAAALSAIGLLDLVAQSPEQYVKIAACLANDVQRLSDLRGTLRERMVASPLMDGKTLTRNIEAAYRHMWKGWCSAEALGNLKNDH